MVIIGRTLKLSPDDSYASMRLERFVIETCLANPDLGLKVFKK